MVVCRIQSSMNSHYTVDYQMQSSTDDYRFAFDEGLVRCVLFRSITSLLCSQQHVCSHANDVCNRWFVPIHASLF